ncbi:MAG: hypothetical protein AB1668_03570 [Nanoarchaeota archaeon]
MVLEQLLSTHWLQKRPLCAVFLGIAYTFIAAITSYIFFKDSFSVSLLFLITVLLVPSLLNLLAMEEERERIEGLHHFFYNHKEIFEIYLFLFIGLFIGYLAVIWAMLTLGMDINVTLSEQVKMLGETITKGKVESFSVNQLTHALSIFSVNVGVAVILFILSLFYGAGSIFLVVWNASIFSTFIYTTISNISRSINHSIALFGIFSIYIIPELAGFLLAAIAGGVVSKAVLSEKFLSPTFRNVTRDAFVLLLISFAFLLAAAFLESYVGVNAIKMLV